MRLARRIGGPTLGALKLTAPSQQSVAVLWTPPLMYETQRLFIRVRLEDENGILAIADSPTIVRGRFETARVGG